MSNFLLDLYRGSQEMSVDEFQDYSLHLLKALVPFDSARYVGGTLTRQGVSIHESFLVNKPFDAITDYAQIAADDDVLRTLCDNPGRVVRFHPKTLFSAKEKKPLFEYATRFEHGNGMSVLSVGKDSPSAEAVSIFRADDDDHFLERDSWTLQQVLPHLLEALKINRALAIHRSFDDANCNTSAITNTSGVLQFCGNGFRTLVNVAWPDWEGAKLPHALMQEIVRVVSSDFCMADIRISVKRIGELLFLRASRSSSESGQAIQPGLLQSRFGLSPAESRVAMALLRGGSSRDVADELNVSPHTVRAQIKQIYSKLGVDTRARLIRRMLEMNQRANESA